MLENIAARRAWRRLLERGADRFPEIGFTVMSMTFSLVACSYRLFMGGIVGRLFREFAGTASVAILISGLVSLTLTPVLCVRWLGRKT